MRIDNQAPTATRSGQAPRLQRSAAAVIAQYIQDLTLSARGSGFSR
jgi:hypothetical protein